jgi:hypothetical protein
MHLVHKILKNNCERLREIKEGNWNREREMGFSDINHNISMIEK